MTGNASVNVLVVGAGMYTCGLGTDGYGTILPAIYEGRRHGLVAKVTIAGKDPKKRAAVLQKARDLNDLMGLSVPVEYWPNGPLEQPSAYKELAQTGEYDCAIVAVPDHLHFQVSADLIRNGIHCLVVKPLTPSVHEVDALIKMQNEHKVYCAVEFHKRFDETNLNIRRMLRENTIGDLLYFLVEYSQRRTIPLQHFRAWAHRTNIFQYLGVHYVDLIFYLTGALPTRVLATGQKKFLVGEGIDAYDSIQALVEWGSSDRETSFTSCLLTNWIDPLLTSAMSDQKIKVIGTAGRIECDQKERGLRLVSDSQGTVDINPYFSDFRADASDRFLEFRGYGYTSIRLFLEDCVALSNGSTSAEELRGLRATFESARVSTSVVEAVNKSLAGSGQWVDVPTRSS